MRIRGKEFFTLKYISLVTNKQNMFLKPSAPNKELECENVYFSYTINKTNKI